MHLEQGLFSALLFTKCECCGRPLRAQITIKHVSVMTRKPTIRWVCFQTVISNILTNSSLSLYGLQVKKYYQCEAHDKPLVKMIKTIHFVCSPAIVLLLCEYRLMHVKIFQLAINVY